MSINTDYAQYREYGLTPKEPEKKEEPPPNDVEKKHVILPGWLNKKRGKAKL